MRRVLTRTVPTAPSAGQSRWKIAALVLSEVVAYVLLVLAVLVIAFVAATAAATPAAAGSDSSTPYTVTPEGLQLPDGRVFGADDVQDANVRTADGRTVNLHFEPGRSHALAGVSFVPWSALGLAPPECVAWVQLHGFDEHFGEGGQVPVCLEGADPTPTPTPSSSAPTPVPGPAPDPVVVVRWVDVWYQCADQNVTQHREVTTTPWVWDAAAGRWVPGEPVVTLDGDGSRPMTPDEIALCPEEVVTPSPSPSATPTPGPTSTPKPSSSPSPMPTSGPGPEPVPDETPDVDDDPVAGEAPDELARTGVPAGDVVVLVVLGLIGAGGILAGLAHGAERKRGGRR